MGTSLHLQWPGPGKVIPNQTSDQTDWPDAFQGVLPVNTPHMCDDVKAQLEEMLDIGAIQKLHSP